MFSGKEQYSYILKNKIVLKDKAIIKKLPMLIRTNGLILTLKYLYSKDKNEIFDLIFKAINEFTNSDSDLKKLENLSSSKYMFLQRNIYNFTLKLRSMIPLIDNSKDNSKNNNYSRKFSQLDKDSNKLSSKFNFANLRLNFSKEYIKSINMNNFNLFFNKYIDLNVKKDKSIILKRDDEAFKYVQSKNEKFIKIYKKEFGENNIASFNVKFISKFAIGIGETSVKEVSIKLDHIYGIPFIPASSIKGAFRNYLEEKYIKENKNLNDINENDQEKISFIDKIFGKDNREGDLIIMDVYPSEFCINTDITNEHYRSYYNENQKPKDSDEPNLIMFPVVNENSIFRFTIFCKENIYDFKKSENELSIEKEFIDFINNGSLGAKTSVGYGRMKYIG